MTFSLTSVVLRVAYALCVVLSTEIVDGGKLWQVTYTVAGVTACIYYRYLAKPIDS